MERNNIAEKEEQNQTSTETALSTEKLLREANTNRSGGVGLCVIDTGLDNKASQTASDTNGNGTHVAGASAGGVAEVVKLKCESSLENRPSGVTLIDTGADVIIPRMVDHELSHGRIIGEQTFGKGTATEQGVKPDPFSFEINQSVDQFNRKHDQSEK